MTKSSRFVIATHTLALLANGGGEPITSEWIAGSVNTNPVVIRRILSMLAKAGLIATQEGAKGGARPARPAADIDLLAVYRAVEEGDLFASHPQPPNPDCPVGCNIQAARANPRCGRRSDGQKPHKDNGRRRGEERPIHEVKEFFLQLL